MARREPPSLGVTRVLEEFVPRPDQILEEAPRTPHIDVVLDVIRRAGSSGMSREQLSLIGTTAEQIAALVERGEIARYDGKRLVWHGSSRDRAEIERLAAEAHRQQPGLA